MVPANRVTLPSEMIGPEFALRAGARYDADSPLVPPAMELAA